LDFGEGSILSNFVCLLELNILIIELVDAVDHGLHQLHLGVAQTVLVGNVISAASLATGLSACATWLHAQLLAAGLEGWHTFGGPSGQIDVHRGSHACSQVAGAGVQISKLIAQLEAFARLASDRLLYGFNSLGQSAEHFLHITTFLHRDDSELILFVDPGQEGLVIIVEDSTTLGPITLHTSGNQVLVARDEQEVIVNELLSDIFVHAQQWVVFTGQLAAEFVESGLHQVLNTQTLIFCDSG